MTQDTKPRFFTPETRERVEAVCGDKAIHDLLDFIEATPIPTWPDTLRQREPFLQKLAANYIYVVADILERKDKLWQGLMTTYEEYYKDHPETLLAFKQSFTQSAFESIGAVHARNGGLGAGESADTHDITLSRLHAVGIPEHKYTEALVEVDKWSKLHAAQMAMQEEMIHVLEGYGISGFEWNEAIKATEHMEARVR